MANNNANHEWEDVEKVDQPRHDHELWQRSMQPGEESDRNQLNYAISLLNLDELVHRDQWPGVAVEQIAMYDRSRLKWHAAVLRRARWCFERAFRMNVPEFNEIIQQRLKLDPAFTYREWQRGRRNRYGDAVFRDGGESQTVLNFVYGGDQPDQAPQPAARAAHAIPDPQTEMNRAAALDHETVADFRGLQYPRLNVWPNQVTDTIRFRRMCDWIMRKNGVKINQSPAQDLKCADTHSSARGQELRQARMRPVPPALQIITRWMPARQSYKFNLPSPDAAAELGFELRERNAMKLTVYQRAVQLICSPRTSADSLLVWHPTGSGKTLSMISVVNNFLLDWVGQKHRRIFIIVPNVVVEQELARNILLDPGFVGHKMRTMNKGRQIAAGSYLTTSQIKEVNKLVTIVTYRKVGPRLGYDVDGSRRRPPSGHPVLAPNTADDAFNPFDNSCVIMDEVHNLLDITAKRDKSTMRSILSLRHAIADAQNLRCYGFTATPNPNDPMEVISLVNFMRCSTARRIVPHRNEEGLAVSKAVMVSASSMISYYDAKLDTKRYPKTHLVHVPVPISREQYDALRPWYKHYFAETNAQWHHDNLPNPFSRSTIAAGGVPRLQTKDRHYDATQDYIANDRDVFDPTVTRRPTDFMRSLGAQHKPFNILEGFGARRVGGRGRGQGRGRGRARGRRRARPLDDDTREELLGQFSDDEDVVLDDALSADDIAHPVWGTGKTLQMWTTSRKICYAAPGATRGLAKHVAKRNRLVRNGYTLVPKIEALVSQLAWFEAYSPIGRDFDADNIGEMGKHIVFSNFKGPGLHAIAHYLSTIGGGFERISSTAQLAASVQARPDAIRFIVLEANSKEVNMLLKSFNAESNSMGSQIALALLYTPMFKEGVEFRDVAAAHIMDPPGMYGELLQIIGRPVRLCSHGRLEARYENIAVKIFMYYSVIGHPKYYEGKMSMQAFSADYKAHLSEAGIRMGEQFTNSTPDEVTLKYLWETAKTSKGIEQIVKGFSVDRSAYWDRLMMQAD